MKKIIVTLLLCSTNFSIACVEENLTTDEAIKKSVLSNYKQVVLNSYKYYQEIFGFSASKNQLKINNFPVLFNNRSQRYSQQEYHTELLYSDLYKQKNIKPIINSTKSSKLIKISNIPVNNGYLSSKFGFRKDPIHGSRRLHKGIDIAAKYGSPVNPLGKGVVVFSGYQSGYGNTVEIQHGKSVLTRYAHLKKFLVDEGQLVDVADKIGLIGSTGRSTGPHLHLEVLLNGQQVDPRIFLANHFGSGAKIVQTAKLKQILKPKITTKAFPAVESFPQISYNDYVKSVDGLFGFTAPASFSQ